MGSACLSLSRNRYSVAGCCNTKPVCLVHLVSLVFLVSLVSRFVWFLSFFEPNQLNKPDRSNEPCRLEIPTAFDRLEQRHFVGVLDVHPDWNTIGDTRNPGSERFQLVR